MKKILFILSAVILLCSCEEGPKRVIVQPKEKNLRIESYRFDFEGHNYIWFQKGFGDHTSGGAIHDPGCKCKRGGDE